MLLKLLLYIFLSFMVKALKNIERHLCDLTSVRSVHTVSAGDQQVSYDMHTTDYLIDIYVHSLDLHLTPLECE